MEFIWEILSPFFTQDWLRVASNLPQIVTAGLATGFQYALIAFGFVLIYRATETVNFAQGDIMMVAMFVGLGFQALGLPWYLMLLATLIVIAGFGALLDLAIFRHMAGQSPLATVIITIAIGFVLRLGTDVVVYFVPGKLPKEETLSPPPLGAPIDVGLAVINPYAFLVIGGGLIVLMGLFFLLSRTRMGIAIQAASQNQLAAYYQGINVRQLNTLVWAVAGSVSAFAGVLFAMDPLKNFNSSVGLSLTGGIMAYAAAVIGGLGSLRGAVIAALLLGVVDNFIKSLAGVHPLISANAGLIFLLLMIVFRPKGLFPQTASKKV